MIQNLPYCIANKMIEDNITEDDIDLFKAAIIWFREDTSWFDEAFEHYCAHKNIKDENIKYKKKIYFLIKFLDCKMFKDLI